MISGVQIEIRIDRHGFQRDCSQLSFGNPDDVLFDLGAGLGKVTLSTAWLSEARAKGVEMEPAYAREAEARARELRFERAEMVRAAGFNEVRSRTALVGAYWISNFEVPTEPLVE